MPKSLGTNCYNNVEEEKLSSQQQWQTIKGFSDDGAVFCRAPTKSHRSLCFWSAGSETEG